jgi:5-methylcytosine-specific restriction endonuclease McrA
MTEAEKRAKEKKRATRTARVREWVARKRVWLIEQMGGCCSNPECRSLLNLEFHHKTVRTWVARKVSRWQRMANYVREWKAGELELLCTKCNKKAGKPKPPHTTDECPF